MRLGVHHRLFWDVMPALPPVKPESDLGSEYEARTPLEFLEIWGGWTVDFSHRIGNGNRKEPIVFKYSKTE